MKKSLLLFFSSALVLFCFQKANATIHTVSVQDFSFSPAVLNVTVGDTIRWVWVNGGHTTTSTSVPGGAASWNSPITSSSTSFSYKVTQPGSYNYQCTPHGPSMAGSFTATMGTGILNHTSSASIQLFPNPVKENLNIAVTSGKSGILNVKVYDVLGKAVLTEQMELNSGKSKYNMAFGSLQAGIYLVTVAVADEKVNTFKINKE